MPESPLQEKCDSPHFRVIDPVTALVQQIPYVRIVFDELPKDGLIHIAAVRAPEEMDDLAIRA